MSVNHKQHKLDVMAARSALQTSIVTGNSLAPRKDGIKKRVIDKYRLILKDGKGIEEAKNAARKEFIKINQEEFNGNYSLDLFDKWINEENEPDR